MSSTGLPSEVLILYRSYLNFLKFDLGGIKDSDEVNVIYRTSLWGTESVQDLTFISFDLTLEASSTAMDQCHLQDYPLRCWVYTGSYLNFLWFDLGGIKDSDEVNVIYRTSLWGTESVQDLTFISFDLTLKHQAQRWGQCHLQDYPLRYWVCTGSYLYFLRFDLGGIKDSNEVNVINRTSRWGTESVQDLTLISWDLTLEASRTAMMSMSSTGLPSEVLSLYRILP